MKSFLALEEVVAIRGDRELFDYFYKQVDSAASWTSFYDEPTRKVKYMYEDGCSLVSCLSEAIVDAPLVDVLSLFGEVAMFKDWFPNVTECAIVKEVTNYRGLYVCK